MTAILCVLLALPGAEPNKDELAKKELEKLQGTWEWVEAERRGKRVKFDNTTKPAGYGDMVVKGDTATVGKVAAKIKLDPSFAPKLIDLDYTEQKFVLETIYKLEGDTLTICYALGTDRVKNRPSEFKTDENSVFEVRVYKRAKK
jgi:uncharacterized protein (TIGR03067 family)